jgi:hypothetical protein
MSTYLASVDFQIPPKYVSPVDLQSKVGRLVQRTKSTVSAFKSTFVVRLPTPIHAAACT